MTDDHWTRYLDRIGQIPLLSRDEVVAAVESMRCGLAAADRISSVPATREPERAALAAAVVAGESAKELLVVSNLRLVVAIARRYRVGSLSPSDLVQEGVLGLLRAVDKFDPDRGSAFSTYATWWIRQAVSQAVAEHCRAIRVPKHVGHEIAACVRTRDRLAARDGHEPSTAEVASVLGADVAEVAVLLRSAAPVHPLSHIDEELTAVDGKVDDAQLAVERAELRERLDHALSRLPAPYGAVLRDRIGWPDGTPLSLRTVARQRGLSRQAARRIEDEAWQMLRDLPQVAGLRDWLYA